MTNEPTPVQTKFPTHEFSDVPVRVITDRYPQGADGFVELDNRNGVITAFACIPDGNVMGFQKSDPVGYLDQEEFDRVLDERYLPSAELTPLTFHP